LSVLLTVPVCQPTHADVHTQCRTLHSDAGFFFSTEAEFRFIVSAYFFSRISHAQRYSDFVPCAVRLDVLYFYMLGTKFVKARHLKSSRTTRIKKPARNLEKQLRLSLKTDRGRSQLIKSRPGLPRTRLMDIHFIAAFGTHESVFLIS